MKTSNKLAEREITRAEAQKRTKQHKEDFAGLRKGWLVLGREVAKSLDLGVPEKLGYSNVKIWIEDTFEESASHILRQLHNVRALRDVPPDKLDQMPEANANQLSRLPEPLRKDPAMVGRAVTESPAEFKETVSAVREKKLGVKPAEPWKTYARRVPLAVYERMIEAEQKIARVLQLDISAEANSPDFEKYMANIITVLEAWAQLVNGTEECRLKTEIEGGE